MAAQMRKQNFHQQLATCLHELLEAQSFETNPGPARRCDSTAWQSVGGKTTTTWQKTGPWPGKTIIFVQLQYVQITGRLAKQKQFKATIEDGSFSILIKERGHVSNVPTSCDASLFMESLTRLQRWARISTDQSFNWSFNTPSNDVSTIDSALQSEIRSATSTLKPNKSWQDIAQASKPRKTQKKNLQNLLALRASLLNLKCQEFIISAIYWERVW